MKEPRYELAVYHGKCIEIIGTFNNYYSNINYRYDDRFGTVPEKAVPYNPENRLIPPMYFIEPSIPIENNVGFIKIDKGSVLNNIEIVGANTFLDHIILQENITVSRNIPLKSKVWLYGRIGAYLAPNKEGGHDYCVDKIISISIIDE